MAGFAQAVHRLHRRRDRLMPDVFADPAWDMMLALVTAEGEGKELSTTGTTLAAGAPRATGPKHLERLEGAGLIELYSNGYDTPLTMVRLTELGRRRMRDVLEGCGT